MKKAGLTIFSFLQWTFFLVSSIAFLAIGLISDSTGCSPNTFWHHVSPVSVSVTNRRRPPGTGDQPVTGIS